MDSYYGTLDQAVPLIDDPSNRTEPSMVEGALWRGTFDNLNLYSMYSTKQAGRYKKSWTNTGLNGIVDGDLKIIDKQPIYNFAAVWDNQKSNAKLGLQTQNQHSDQIWIESGHTWSTPGGNFMKADARAFYAKTKGDSRSLSESYNGKDSTYVVSGQMFWIKDKLTLMGAAGRAGNKLNALLDIDTDLGYVFDLSIDRNGHDMYSWQLASFYQLTPDLNAGFAVTVTDGYEDHTKQVEQKGLGGTLILMHEIKSGQLKGMQTSFMYSKAKEDRKGSKRGDKLKYRDLKFTVHYPMNLF